MKRMIFGAVVAVLAPAAIAQAAPNLSGKYAVFRVFNCEAQINTQINTTKDSNGKVTGVTLTTSGSNSGAMSASVGYITLTPSSPTSGTAAFTPSTGVGGGALRINGQGDPWSKSTKTQTAIAYSYTPTAFTFVDTQVYAMSYGNLDPVSKFHKTINLVGTDKSGSNTHCFSAMTLTQ